jgi:hypothetical protein
VAERTTDEQWSKQLLSSRSLVDPEPDAMSQRPGNGDPWIGRVTIELHDQGYVGREVWYDGEQRWLVADGCSELEPFLADYRVFTLRQDGRRIGWGPITASDSPQVKEQTKRARPKSGKSRGGCQIWSIDGSDHWPSVSHGAET